MGKNDFCCAPGCSSNRIKRPELQFYRIPKESLRRKLWLKRIRREGFTPTENTRLCSVHFTGGRKSDVSSSAAFVPTIFEHSHSNSQTTRSTVNSLKTGKGNEPAELPPVKRRRQVRCNEAWQFECFKCWVSSVPNSIVVFFINF